MSVIPLDNSYITERRIASLFLVLDTLVFDSLELMILEVKLFQFLQENRDKCR